MSAQHAPLLFVGERRSPTAIRMGVTWEDGRVCAKTLHEALDAVGIARDARLFLNAFTDDGRPDPHTVRMAQCHVTVGGVVVGLGERAQRQLTAAGVPHLKLIHPAARGRIRRTDAYRAHVAQILGGLL